jgi:hypothetical protein
MEKVSDAPGKRRTRIGLMRRWKGTGRRRVNVFFHRIGFIIKTGDAEKSEGLGGWDWFGKAE